MAKLYKVVFPRGKDLKPVPVKLAPKQALPALTVTPAMPENPKTRLALETLATLAAQMPQQDLQMAVPAKNLTAVAQILTPAQRMAKGLLPAMLEPLPAEPPELLRFNQKILTEIRQATKIPERVQKRNGH
ncbi:hypothetical protein [Rhizobium halophilum]|uniref:hypothetical protein n=1 Tax=Rhizobium halophilum TaxID=2846852 RepID=UPI001EFE520F|nr:hypothetical protein [Rhizobium halophilum]MCF6368324.1 hypothetical protein [Rhizobium halophilum]